MADTRISALEALDTLGIRKSASQEIQPHISFLKLKTSLRLKLVLAVAKLVSPGISVTIHDVSVWPSPKRCDIITRGEGWSIVELGDACMHWLEDQPDNGWYRIKDVPGYKFLMSDELITLMKLSV